MEGSHNAENIASILDATLSKWDIRSKCEAITTDNAQTMINAAAKLHIRHIPCFAHTLNLTMSTLASDKLRAIQRELNKPELKVIQEVPTRWNSAYHMLQRIVTMKTELTLALNECNRAPPGVNADEYLIIQETIQILEPF
ncbi:unnamed protein product [Parnassius apollo]|uniref:(apollo) hypothetical protein n=1 Tax=Parnassius apollo TaxID=110799 RepID=A0A8S3X271_PARAO|nr:unnamed protein product [Parnassius apollo]